MACRGFTLPAMVDPLADAAVAVGAALVAGDLAAAQAAFRPIHRALYPRVRAFVRGRLRGSADRDADADEVVSEAFLALWRQMGRFDPARGSLGGLLYTIARRIVARRGRRALAAAAVEVHVDADDAMVVPDAGADVVGEAEARWQAENRGRLLSRLDEEAPEASALLRRRMVGGESLRQVAEALGVSHAAARQRDLMARLAFFRVGWQMIRERRPGSGLRAWRPKRVAELKAAMAADPMLEPTFADWFGEGGWGLVRPRRGHG